MLTEAKRKYIEKKSRILKKHVIEMTYSAQSGHPGGSFSLADIISTLYFHEMKHDPKIPGSMDRDRVVLSKGHAAPILYAALVEAGYLDIKTLEGFRKIGCLLQGHPCIQTPGIDVTTGSLGLGLSAACGLALGAELRGKNGIRIFAILGDGELGEGQIWEAALAASNFRLNNLIAIIDRNRYQNDGATEDILKLEPLADKWRSFGWNVIEINGHDIEQIAEAFLKARASIDKPVMIIANTIKGNGASYMLDKPQLHYTPPTKEQMELTLKELGF